MPLFSAGGRASLRASLLDTRIAGDTRTPRESVVRNAEKLAAGDPDKFLGLGPVDLPAAEVMQAVARFCGCSPDLAEREGPGVIDVDLTLEQVVTAAERFRAAAERGERVLVATGHPTGLLSMYLRIADALEESGAKNVTPVEDVAVGESGGRRTRRVRSIDGVACLSDGADLRHTHDWAPMERLLDALDQPPGLVLADHGFAGTAIARGLETIAFNDVNDPALWVAKQRGMTEIVVPLDDNVPPSRYRPLAVALDGIIRGHPRAE